MTTLRVEENIMFVQTPSTPSLPLFNPSFPTYTQTTSIPSHTSTPQSLLHPIQHPRPLIFPPTPPLPNPFYTPPNTPDHFYFLPHLHSLTPSTLMTTSIPSHTSTPQPLLHS
ncbi:hypothetical protein Pcinc_032532 [Petrolisthes cinctipes]|uniref:Uncharacterized protein n=1 Tax=Petrolisthes cinctipes TaxID=88211 RepID=A0AAE1EUD9_PETCI|nr:hypothetical protein Pcinc_032532 [Petrolisthes cinctipes]